MRISQDSDSWRAGGVIRRDFRATRGDPEIPRIHSRHAPGSKPVSSRCSRAPGGVHEVEHCVAAVWREFEHVTGRTRVCTQWTWRCRWCYSRSISTHLLGPVADLLGNKMRAALLSAVWCREGHLITHGDNRWSSNRSSRSWRGDDWWCVMCGTGRWAPHAVTDRRLWSRLALENDILERVLVPRSPAWLGVTIIYEECPEKDTSKRTAVRLRRRAAKRSAPPTVAQ
jgi:hypothetical protein